jgi:hypothetical protein
MSILNGIKDSTIVNGLAAIDVDTSKIDDAAADGITGIEDSLAYRVSVVDGYFHIRERWFGKSADQSGNNWGADTLTPFQAISGAGVYGADANDEAKVVGSDDTPIFVGDTRMAAQRILVVGVSVDTHYKLRVVYGTGTMADAITALQYTEIMVKFDATNPQQSAGIPFDIKVPRLDVGTKIWLQAKNATDNATIDFFVGGHENEG